jgi:hypothetical protein
MTRYRVGGEHCAGFRERIAAGGGKCAGCGVVLWGKMQAGGIEDFARSHGRFTSYGTGGQEKTRAIFLV